MTERHKLVPALKNFTHDCIIHQSSC